MVHLVWRSARGQCSGNGCLVGCMDDEFTIKRDKEGKVTSVEDG